MIFRWPAGAIALIVLSSSGGCHGVQSALDPAGREAEQIADLFWWMAGSALVIWLIVTGIAVYSIWIQPTRHNRRSARLYIIGGGVVFPTVVLVALLIYGLRLLPRLVAPAPEGSLQVHVNGLQWWWRVRYMTPDGGAVETANEVRLPVGDPVQFVLNSHDVIHAFWIPSLGGKMDMFPGRDTRLTLTPTRTGTFRGQCAEYCGTAHAQMSFDVIVMEPADFDNWLEEQRKPAVSPQDDLSVQGKALFASSGCHACHTVRGTAAAGTIGPDLTHVGGRTSLGAACLKNDSDSYRRWIAETDIVKPGVLMPSFHMLEDDDHRALAAYLEQLK